MNFQEEKKDQNKYYLSYAKPSVLDMKWENCDTNVCKKEKILILSMLDDIGTSLRLFELLFDDELVEMVNGYTKLYGHRDKAGTSFEITNKTFCSFLQ